MARKSTKQIGALVELYRRKTKGLGIILDVMDSEQISKIWDSKWTEAYNRNELTEKRKSLFQCYGYYDKWPAGSVRKYAYVRWMKRPSEWEAERITRDHDWYPADLLRAVK
tara:strand:- start:358 stop:690 length:333 start_codon:yes stop_codon:yes gene_type:complete